MKAVKERKKIMPELPTPPSWRRLWIGVALIPVILIILLAGGLMMYSVSYRDRVLPGIHVGDIAVGGMDKEDLTEFLRAMNDKLVADGLRFEWTVDGRKEEFFLSPVLVSPSGAIELMQIDTEAEAERLLSYGKTGDWWTRLSHLLAATLDASRVTLGGVRADKDRIISILRERLAAVERPMTDATVEVESLDPLQYSIKGEQVGRSFQYELAVDELARAWSVLQAPQVAIRSIAVAPQVRTTHVAAMAPFLDNVFSAGEITLKHIDPVTERPYKWQIEKDDLQSWINVQPALSGETSLSGFTFGLELQAVADYLKETVSQAVEREPRDAKFAVSTSTGKVAEFQGSRPGVSLDISETYAALNDVIDKRTSLDSEATSTIFLAVHLIEPIITTGEANDLGITELLGTGISKYAGSPANRIKNIRNAVKKLNGILIKPDEEFSALKYTEPFTLDGGYLPELVIKGDSITPEIGGGLCQIGTTLFRMAMKSGMPIAERRNHSLVVSYYNDLENGLPGTDATIYDPAPDFRFKNDTGNYVLIQTEMDEKDGFLFFSLWGKNDGRKGSYTKPEVKKWVGHGPTKTVETTKLAVGEKKCQHAYRGAETAFTYTRELPDGTKDETLFESYYRPLPEICLVGVEAVEEGAVVSEELTNQQAPAIE